jgi:hypothetical protein
VSQISNISNFDSKSNANQASNYPEVKEELKEIPAVKDEEVVTTKLDFKSADGTSHLKEETT